MQLMRLAALATAVAAVAVGVVVSPAAGAGRGAPPVQTLRFIPGWDDHNAPLNLKASWVKVDARVARTLTLTYHLVGGAPSTTHTLGLHLFPPKGAAKPCLDSFGQYGSTACDQSEVRENRPVRVAQAFDFENVVLDAKGNGTKVVAVRGIAPGTYQAEFDVRTSDCRFCDLIFQTPGPFGRTATFRILP